MGIFSTTAVAPKRYVHKLGFMNTLTMQDFGVLYPMLAKELVPGDVIKHKHAMNMFYFPQSSNVMHGFRLKSYYFFVPYRIVWPLWDAFFSDHLHTYIKPYAQARDFYNLGNGHQYWQHGSLADYLGMNSFPKGQSGDTAWDTSDDTRIDTLFFRAYQKVFVDHFIDQQVSNHNLFAQLVNETIIPHSGGEDTNNFPALFNLRSACWNKDLFTTALSRQQEGGAPTISGTFDMSTLRVTAAIDKYRQILTRIGVRAKEFTRGIFGVTPSDYRLDMAEFLTATSDQIIKGQVVNHNASTGSDAEAQGFIASEFKSGGISGNFKYKCREFGVLMGLACIIPDAVYYQGINRQFLKQDATDHFNPYFEHIGDQNVLNMEIYLSPKLVGSVTDPNKDVFGYAPRYSEYKYYDNEVHGLFRDAAYLDYHDAKSYSSKPIRSGTPFAQISNPIAADGSIYAQYKDFAGLKRIFNITEGTPIAGVQFYHKFDALRPMDRDSAVYFKG